jgi:hypothetical protein
MPASSDGVLVIVRQRNEREIPRFIYAQAVGRLRCTPSNPLKVSFFILRLDRSSYLKFLYNIIYFVMNCFVYKNILTIFIYFTICIKN